MIIFFKFTYPFSIEKQVELEPCKNSYFLVKEIICVSQFHF